MLEVFGANYITGQRKQGGRIALVLVRDLVQKKEARTSNVSAFRQSNL